MAPDPSIPTLRSGHAVVSVAMMTELIRLLRECHAAVYDALGRPGFLNNSIQNGFAVLRFILGDHFRQTQDPELSLSLSVHPNLFLFILGMFHCRHDCRIRFVCVTRLCR